MKILQGQVRGDSPDGKDAPSGEITANGFKPDSKVHVVLTGWSFEFKAGHHPIFNMGIWLQQAVQGAWAWCQEVDADRYGAIRARYIGFAGSENRDNPFTFLVNYMVIGE